MRGRLDYVSRMTRYIVIGAGAVGGTLGGKLTQHGVDAVLIARGEHGKALVESGLRLRTPDENLTLPVAAATGPAEVRLGLNDVLVIATKTHQAANALTQWADQPVYDGESVAGTAGELLPVLTVLNGVASELLALRYFRLVYGVCIWLPAVHLEPGEVIARSAPVAGLFHIGRFPADIPDDSRLLQQVEEDWTRAGFAIRLPNDVMEWKYNKLLSNIVNAIQALVGKNGDFGSIVKQARAEASGVLDAAGIAYADRTMEAELRAIGPKVRPVPGEPDELGGSSWQSLARGTGNIETDYLNGEIALIARQHGLAAPINTKIASLARIAAATGQRPGDISAAELAVVLGLTIVG